MGTKGHTAWPFGAGLLLALLVVVAGAGRAGAQDQTPGPAPHEAATPAPAYSCDAATAVATPAMEHDMGGMAMGTPMAGMEMEVDQLFIDMMIPHHASIVAMAQAALDRLEDERLREIAERIVATQSAEIEELRGYREDFYGSAEPMPMDDDMMGAMEQMMPGMPVSTSEMMAQMDAATQVSLVCAAQDTDLAFIDLTIPHHESAIAVAEATVGQAAHPEIRDFAQRVIEDQRAEIAELEAIREDLYGAATPGAASSPAAVSHGGPVVDHVGLVDALRGAGFTVDVAGGLAPDVPFGGAQTGTVLRLSGGGLAAPAEVQSFEYADPAAAAADAGQILPDGNTRTAMIHWVGPPHFFRAGRLIVLYVGSDQAVVDHLTRLLGPQFAGRQRPGTGTAPR